MIDARVFDDISNTLGKLLPPGVSDMKDDFEQNAKATLQSALGKLDLVTREEFDVQTQVLLNTPVDPSLRIDLLRSAVKWLFTGLALVLLWQLSLSYTVTKLQETQQRRQSAQLADLDRQLTQFSFIPKLLSGDVEIRQALVATSGKSIDAANRRLQRTRQDSGLDVAFLLDRSGLTIASSNWSDTLSFVGISYSFRPYFKNAVKGRSATFFAVGATTGIPGYFIAEPVTENSTVVGVVVAKVSLDVLVDAWDTLLYDSLVVDEFGGVILSTREDLLYTPTAPGAHRAENFARVRREGVA